MFELQPCHYYEIFSQCFAYYGWSKPKEVKMPRNYIFYFIWCDVKIYLCNKNICHKVLKIENIFKNDWNGFEFLWNLKYLLNIMIPYDWNKFMNCRKNLIIIISLINFFKVMTICMVNLNFEKKLFSNKRLEEIWGGTFLKFSFKMLLGWIIQTKT